MHQTPVIDWPGRDIWGPVEKIIFRFVFVYFLLFIEPWMWILDYIPVIPQYIYQAKDWLVHVANDRIFHSYKELVPVNGSGDTSFGWTEMKLDLLIAVVATVVWTLVDRSSNYNRLSYWLRIIIRYNLIAALLSYGIIKLFCQQMVFPSLSQLATPLGDLLPMRLSWLFIGYSNEYQFFSGLMEVLAAVLLFFRRTSAFGAVVSAAVFLQVAVLNLSYDIPVKIYSIHLFLSSVVLMIYEHKRLLSFILNRPSAPSYIYEVSFVKKWQRGVRLFFKYGMTTILVVMMFYQSYQFSTSKQKPEKKGPITKGIYEVQVFALNKDTLPLTSSMVDPVRWNDVIFEEGSGSVNTTDTLFWQRYRRGYFNYNVNDSLKTLVFNRPGWTGARDSILSFRYEMPDSIHIRLWGKLRNDSLYLLLKRNNRHFQLTERQFHWLSEYNR